MLAQGMVEVAEPPLPICPLRAPPIKPFGIKKSRPAVFPQASLKDDGSPYASLLE
jgi:hypothetical protein